MGISPTQTSEWGRAEVVLLAQPGLETLFGILETNSANFLYPFDLKKARDEHSAFRKLLENFGTTVIDIREALIMGTINEDGSPLEGPKLDSLRKLAETSVSYLYDEALSLEDRAFLDKNRQRMIKTLHPTILADISLLRPTLAISYNPRALDPTSRFISTFRLEPATNQYFMRDGMITTPIGCVIGNFTLDVRKVENALVKFALKQLGIEPIYTVEAPGHLEGGDFLPAGEFVLQGQGLLSDEYGVRQLLEKKVYGFVEVGIVRDPRSQMDEMHLDTYFNFLSEKEAVLCEDRMKGEMQPLVDVWLPAGSAENYTYRKKATYTLLNYLKDKGIRVIPFSKEEQENFAPNYLLLDKRKLIGVSKTGSEFWRRLRESGMEVHLLDFCALTGGYGGPHCMSQVIRRAPERS